jgi:hypothetical protein
LTSVNELANGGAWHLIAKVKEDKNGKIVNTRQVHLWGISSKTGYSPVNGRKASVGEPAATGKYRCTVSL